jgi:hemolysin III
VVEEELKPVLRGVSHAVSFWIALVAGVVLIAIARDADARVAATIYALGLCALFGASGLYHRWRWNPRWQPLLRRIDHSTIFLFVAASYTPVGLLVLEDTLQVVVLGLVWAGALAGVIFSVAWISAPRALVAGCYLALGWVAVIAMPQLIDRLPAAPLVLLATGGLLYTIGAAIYAAKRPDPWPRVFGFHEVFHAFVIAAALVHFVAMAGWVIA